jgi:hypothetical protein
LRAPVCFLQKTISLSLASLDPGAEAFSYQNIGNAPFSDKDNALSLRHVSHIHIQATNDTSLFGVFILTWRFQEMEAGGGF